jgi:hypothetical protein
VQDDSSLGSGHFLLALFALCLLALLVFASAASAQQTAGPGRETTAERTSAASPSAASPSAASPSAASPSATASPEVTSSADELTADVPRDADEFRCNFFLHEVRDVRGNVRRQYEDLSTRRFERCLSKDVIPGTIVKRRLPATGGVPLLVLGFPAIALVGAGILLARRR